MKIHTYTIKGTKGADFTLPKEFAEKANLKLLAQAIHVYEERSHTGLRNTKTRSEVNRTKKKVYKQKGTGGARHGSRRANVFVGGGVIFGPRPLRRILTLPDKLKLKAKMTAFSAKLSEDQVIGVTGIGKIEKTKEPAGFLKKVGKETKSKRFTFVLSEASREITKFLRNLEAVSVVTFKEANALDIWNGGLIVLDQDIFKKAK